MTERFRVYENAEGTVIEIDGHPIQFSMVLTDVAIAKYISERAQHQLETLRNTESLWMNAPLVDFIWGVGTVKVPWSNE